MTDSSSGEAMPMSGSLLCVDDDPETLKIRKLLLEARGYRVFTSTSGRDALHILAQGATVQLVMLDYLMPGMNGDELAQRLRRLYPSLPLMVVSAVGQLPQSLLKMTDAAVQKGQDPELLLATIATVLAKPTGQDANEPIAPQSQKTILCIEDEEMELKLRKMLFESAGYRVLEARSAQAAMDVFRSAEIDAVVMDYWLSGTRGTGMAEEMKQLRPKVPIIMFSGFGSLPGEGTVVDSWMQKTAVQPEGLIVEVERLIELRSAHPHTNDPE